MIKEKAFAKLNLNLHVLADDDFKRKTGYFPIQFINCELDLHDEIILEKQPRTISLACNIKELQKKDNLIYRAASLLKEELNDNRLGAKITLMKNIPIRAGLGGGSSDAAATIRALQRLWKVKFKKEILQKIINSLGCDVFYSMRGGLSEITGTGNVVKPIRKKLAPLWVVLITPEIKKPSTAWMYKHLDTDKIGRNLHVLYNMKKALLNYDKNLLLDNIFNDFDLVVKHYFPEVALIKQDLRANGALKELVAGSGLTVLGLYDTKTLALKAFKNLQIKYKTILWSKIKS